MQINSKLNSKPCDYLYKLDEEIELLNNFITLVKLHRNHGVAPNLSASKEIVKMKFRTKKYIAMKNNTELYFQAELQPHVQFILQT